MKKLLVVLLFLAASAGATVIWKQKSELEELRFSPAERPDESEWRRRVDALTRQNRELQAELANYRRQLAELRNVETAGTEEPTGGEREGRGGWTNQRDRRGPAGNMIDILENPQVAAMVAGRQRAMIDSRYGHLFRQLNLSPPELDRLRELLAEREMTSMEVMALARAEGVGRDASGELRDLIRESRGEVENDIRQLLGDDRFTQLNQYEATLPDRSRVNQFAQRLGNSTEPLQPYQSDELIRILSQARTTAASATADVAQTDRAAVQAQRQAANQQALAQAQTILTPGQFEAFQQFQSEQAGPQRSGGQQLFLGRGGGTGGGFRPRPGN